jgi:hypothetical protein
MPSSKSGKRNATHTSKRKGAAGNRSAARAPATDASISAAASSVEQPQPPQPAKQQVAVDASSSASIAGDVLDAIPNVRVGAKLERPSKKKCGFHCGAVCFETPDPVDTGMTSIRWERDPAGALQSSGTGAHDWYCERTWSEVAPTTEHRSRSLFQSELAKDVDKLTLFLAKRASFIGKQKTKTVGRKGAGFAHPASHDC